MMSAVQLVNAIQIQQLLLCSVPRSKRNSNYLCLKM